MKLGPKLPDEWRVTLSRRISGKLKPYEDSHTHQSVFQSGSLLMNGFRKHQLVCLQAHVLRLEFSWQFLAVSSFLRKKCISYILDAIVSACSISFNYLGGAFYEKNFTITGAPCIFHHFNSTSCPLSVLYILSFTLCPSCFPICLLQVRFKTSQLSLCGAL